MAEELDEDIVVRLRYHDTTGYPYYPPICGEAADVIEHLRHCAKVDRERIEKLNQELSEALWEIVSYGGHFDKQTGEYDSQCLSGPNWAMRQLEDMGELEIVREYGRRLIAVKK